MDWQSITGLFGLGKEAEFKHESPVDGNSVRLIQIKPSGSLTFGFGRPELTIEPFPLDGVPQFLALSYTWGPPDPRIPEYVATDKCPILINGQVYYVFPNLLDALYRLRADLDKVNPYFWIDALCINQDDPEERATQVGIMDRIYKQANHTLVWLGKPRSTWEKMWVSHIMTAIVKIPSEEVAEMVLSYPDIPILPPKPLDHYKLPRLEAEEIWLAILYFFQQRWFNRAWIIQEVALSKSIVFLWGNQTLTWDGLHNVAAFLCRATRLGNHLMTLQARKLVKQGREGPLTTIDPIVRFFELALLRGQCQEEAEAGRAENSDTSELREFIWMTTNDTQMAAATLSMHFALAHRAFEASDPRDRIFGYLGLVNHLMDRDNDSHQRSQVIAPDYTESATPASVFEQVVSQAILHTQSLVILTALNGIGDRLQELPSWVPDLSIVEPFPMLMGIRPYFDASKLSSRDDTSNELKTSRGIVKIDDHNLQVSAIRVGQIDFLGVHDRDIVTGYLHTWVKTLLSHEPTYRHTGESRVEAFWRTIVMNQSGGYSPARWPEHENGQPFRSWIMVKIWNRYWKDGNEVETVDGVLNPLRLIDDLSAIDSAGHMPSAADFRRDYERMEKIPEKIELVSPSTPVQELRAIDHAAKLAFDASLAGVSGQRFVVSDQGHYILAPMQSKQGDNIVILAGCPCPMVVRPHPKNPSSFVIIGAAYVHGIMHGEAVTDDVQWEDMCIA